MLSNRPAPANLHTGKTTVAAIMAVSRCVVHSSSAALPCCLLSDMHLPTQIRIKIKQRASQAEQLPALNDMRGRNPLGLQTHPGRSSAFESDRAINTACVLLPQPLLLPRVLLPQLGSCRPSGTMAASFEG